jgi:hypothetical protein
MSIGNKAGRTGGYTGHLNHCATNSMKTLLAALIAGAFAFAHGPAVAQDKKPAPTKEEVKKDETKKDETKKDETKTTETKTTEKAEAKKDEGKKKVKKGGC